MVVHHHYRFHQFTYDALTGELATSSEKVRLQPQPAAALRILLENAGQLVTRERLKQTIWPDTVVEADAGLNFCVRQVRLALGEDAEGAKFIETLPRRGYRFVAPVSLDGEHGGSQTGDQRVGESEVMNARIESTPRRSFATRWLTATVALLAAVAVAAAFFSNDRAGSRGTTIAILPLRTAGGSQWVAEQNNSLTEALVSALTNSSQTLGIIGPATTGRFANSSQPHTQIGIELNADFVVSGGLRISDSTMFVQAVRVTDGVHVFAWRQPINGRSADSLAALVAMGIAARLR